jgi:acetyl esterase/lipase
MLQIVRVFSRWLAPARDALFNTSIPWDWRLRLIGLQIFLLITYPMKQLPYLFSNRYKSITIPTRGRHTLRAIVFQPPKRDTLRPAPLHLHFHSGGFIGGIAEAQADWCSLVSDRVGAVVVSAEYRVAPRYGYPCAHEDAEDIVGWTIANASKLWNSDPTALTVSGFSAGCNLMFMAGARATAAIGFYAPVRYRAPSNGNGG